MRIILRRVRIFLIVKNKNLFRTVGYGTGLLLRSFAAAMGTIIATHANEIHVR